MYYIQLPEGKRYFKTFALLHTFMILTGLQGMWRIGYEPC